MGQATKRREKDGGGRSRVRGDNINGFLFAFVHTKFLRIMRNLSRPENEPQ